MPLLTFHILFLSVVMVSVCDPSDHRPWFFVCTHRVESMDTPSLRRHCRTNEVSYSRLSRKMHYQQYIFPLLVIGYSPFFPNRSIDRLPLQRKCMHIEPGSNNKQVIHSLTANQIAATRIEMFFVA